MASHAQQARGDTRSLVFHYLIFATLGLACSFFWNFYYNNVDYQHLRIFPSQTEEHSLEEVRTILHLTDCEDVKREAKVPDDLKDFMGTKLRYQFEPVIKSESSIGHCHATKVYGLIRHGTRYPTLKHVKRWEELQWTLLDRLPPESTAAAADNSNTMSHSNMMRNLRQWSNSLHKDVTEGRARAAELTADGMKEQYCLGRRLRERFPEILKPSYSPLSYDFRSTLASRAVKSALAYAHGLFKETNLKVINIKSMEEKDDVFLRYDEHPCPEYDQKVSHNTSFDDWLHTFFDTPTYIEVVKNIQRHFNPDHWKPDRKDVLTFYKICIHELSVLGESRWCDLFSPKDLSVLQFYTDLKTFWVKGGGHSITGKRSVHLVQAILDFLSKGKQHTSLSFAHAETILPLLTFLEAFPVPSPLTPTNYHELKTREFVTSQIIPYSANVYLILYNCKKHASNPSKSSDLYVRLLVNEKPVRIGLCSKGEGEDQESDWEEGEKGEDHWKEGQGHWEEEEGEDHWKEKQLLCSLDLLKEAAYNRTAGFSSLAQLCKTTH